MWTAPIPSTARAKSESRRHSTTTRWPCSAQSSCAVPSAIAPPPTTIITGSPGSATAGSSVLPIGRISVLDSSTVFDVPASCLTCHRNRAGGDWYLAVAARIVEHIGRLAQPGDAAAKRANELLASRDAGAEMRGAWRKIGMVKVVRLDPHRDETAKQGLQNSRIVVDAAQQDGLRQKRDAGAGEPGQSFFCCLGQLARVVRMNHHVDRLLRRERSYERWLHPAGIDDRNTRVKADHRYVGDSVERVHNLGEAARRQHKGIAAGDDDLPDLRSPANVIKGA